MAFEDLFGGKHTISPEANIVTNPNPSAMDQGDDSQGFDFEALFADPNFIRGLGEAGAATSSGDSAGEVLGNFASNMTRRKAVQKGARGARESRGRNEKLMNFLFENKFLGGREDNETDDFIKISADGTINSGMKNTPQKPGFQRNQSLESQRRPSPGGDDLPDFSNQSGGSDFDFAGLDAEDIGMLLKAEQQFGQLDQRQMKLVLDEKNRRQAAVASSKNRTEELKRLGEERLAKSFKEKRKSVAKVDAAKLSKNELAVEALELRKLTKEVEDLEAGEGTATPSQQANIDKINADLERRETELGIKLDKLEKEEFFSVQPSFVDNKGNEIDVPFEEREANANQSNNRPDNKVFYRTIQPIVTEFFDGKADQDGNVVPIFLPKRPTTGKQITSQDVIDTAKTNKISLEEVLRQWGLIK
jgi:hypothetical protein